MIPSAALARRFTALAALLAALLACAALLLVAGGLLVRSERIQPGSTGRTATMAAAEAPDCSEIEASETRLMAAALTAVRWQDHGTTATRPAGAREQEDFAPPVLLHRKVPPPADGDLTASS